LNVALVIDVLAARDLLRVLDDVCRARHVTRAEVCGCRRTKAIVAARHEVWWRLRHHPELSFSYEEIGRLFGRDHTTVLAAVRAKERARAKLLDEVPI
jgi:chromosomal replication initiation ATPase DnaA